MHPRTGCLGAVAASMLLVPAALGQCGPQWLPGDGIPGIDRSVYALINWDPDGPGPRGPVVVAGGEFTQAGDVLVQNIAVWDPVTTKWSALGTGMNAAVLALAVLPGGDLIAGGSFTMAGGAPASFIARWDGARWTGVGGGTNDDVRGLAVLPGGDIVATGDFTSAGGGPVNHVARWDGSGWRPMGPGVDGVGSALVVSSGGDLYIGGGFTAAGGAPVNRIARWDGAAWAPLGSGVNGFVWTLAALPGGDIVAGGVFLTAGGVSVNRIARWDGAMWHALGGGVDDDVRDVTALPGGELVAVGAFDTADGTTVDHIARWDGARWSAVGPRAASGADSVLLAAGGELIVSGGFGIEFLGGAARGIARWDGAAWRPLGGGTNFEIYDLAVLPGGDVVAAGRFFMIGGVEANRVARWNGATWSALGSGVNGRAYAVAGMPNGDVVVMGDFTLAGGRPANRIARWDGREWHPMGEGLTDTTLFIDGDLLVLPSGELVAVAAYFGRAGGVEAGSIALWDGAAWSNPFGPGFGGITVARLHDGRLAAGRLGLRELAIPILAVWDGLGWSVIDGGLTDLVNDYIYDLEVMPNGDLIASGYFGPLIPAPAESSLARWDGSRWWPMGWPGLPIRTIAAMAVSPDGDLIVGGGYKPEWGGMARWDGAAWHPYGTGTTGGTVQTIAVLPNDDVVVGGTIKAAGGKVSSFFAHWSETGGPWVAEDPEPRLIIAGMSLMLSATPTSGYSDVTFQWVKDGVSIPGASGLLPSPTDGTPAVFTIDAAVYGDTGDYRIIFSNPCAEAGSATARVVVGCSTADLTADGVVDFADYAEFLDLYEAADALVDYNRDGFIDFADYLEFLNAFDAGC